jgi:hypothetical protein
MPGEASMSEKGHSLPKWAICAMSGLPPLASELQTLLEVRFVPTRDSCTAANETQVSL